VLIAIFLDPNETITDIWVALCIPGFIGDVVFSVVLWITEGCSGLTKLSLGRLATWGSMTGLLLGVLSFAIGTPSGRFLLLLLVGRVHRFDDSAEYSLSHRIGAVVSSCQMGATSCRRRARDLTSASMVE